MDWAIAEFLSLWAREVSVLQRKDATRNTTLSKMLKPVLLLPRKCMDRSLLKLFDVWLAASESTIRVFTPYFDGVS